MIKLNIIFLTCAIFALCESFNIGDIIEKKCGGYDNDCQKEIFHKVWAVLVDSGIQDLGIPKIDPYEIINMEINVLGLMHAWLKEGTLEGLKTCYASKFKNSKKNLAAEIELTCSVLNLKGKYKLKSAAIVSQIVGDRPVRGEGMANFVADKVKINMVLPYKIKSVNGELYYDLKTDKVTSNMDILGKATLAADNILVGKQDISAAVVNAFNENWKFLLKSFGNIVFEKVIEVISDLGGKFFNGVRISDMCTDDLSAYVTN